MLTREYPENLSWAVPITDQYSTILRPTVTTTTAVQNTIKRVNASSKQAIINKLSEIRASNYPTIRDFHLCFVEFRRELSALKQTYDDDWCVNRVMKAMESVNLRWVEAAKFQ